MQRARNSQNKNKNEVRFKDQFRVSRIARYAAVPYAPIRNFVLLAFDRSGLVHELPDQSM